MTFQWPWPTKLSVCNFFMCRWDQSISMFLCEPAYAAHKQTNKQANNHTSERLVWFFSLKSSKPNQAASERQKLGSPSLGYWQQVEPLLSRKSHNWSWKLSVFVASIAAAEEQQSGGKTEFYAQDVLKKHHLKSENGPISTLCSLVRPVLSFAGTSATVRGKKRKVGEKAGKRGSEGAGGREAFSLLSDLEMSDMRSSEFVQDTLTLTVTHTHWWRLVHSFTHTLEHTFQGQTALQEVLLSALKDVWPLK